MLLATPGKSLFLSAPLLVLSFLSIGRIWRLERGLAAGVASACAIGLIFYAAYLFPEGGYAHGPRHLVPIVPLAALLAAGPAADRWPRAAWMACGGVGFAFGLLAVSVSFLEDQALRRDTRGQAVAGYYELIDPPPGRANKPLSARSLSIRDGDGFAAVVAIPGVGPGPRLLSTLLTPDAPAVA